MIFTCPKCKQELKCEDAAIGELIECPNCNEAIRVPFQKRLQNKSGIIRQFDCSKCSHPIEYHESMIGELVECPRCKEEVIVPTQKQFSTDLSNDEKILKSIDNSLVEINKHGLRFATSLNSVDDSLKKIEKYGHFFYLMTIISILVSLVMYILKIVM